MANGYQHSAFEASGGPGNEINTPTLSTKVIYSPLISVNPALNPDPMERDDELRNQDEALSVIPEQYNPEWDYEGRAYPDITGFRLKHLCGAPTSTAGDGIITDPDAVAIPTGATRHVWSSPFPGADSAHPITTQEQFAYKDQAVFFKGKGAACNKLSLESPAQGGVRLKCGGPINFLGRIADPALTPTYESLAIAPFLRRHLTIKSQVINGGQVDDFSVNMENPVETARTLGFASAFPDTVEKGDGPILVSGDIPKRQLDQDDWDALLNATGFALTARWQSTVNIGATTYKYALWLEVLNAQLISGGPEALANKRRHAATYGWKATYAGTSPAVKWTLVNATTSYA